MTQSGLWASLLGPTSLATRSSVRTAMEEQTMRKAFLSQKQMQESYSNAIGQAAKKEDLSQQTRILMAELDTALKIETALLEALRHVGSRESYKNFLESPLHICKTDTDLKNTRYSVLAIGPAGITPVNAGCQYETIAVLKSGDFEDFLLSLTKRHPFQFLKAQRRSLTKRVQESGLPFTVLVRDPTYSSWKTTSQLLESIKTIMQR